MTEFKTLPFVVHHRIDRRDTGSDRAGPSSATGPNRVPVTTATRQQISELRGLSPRRGLFCDDMDRDRRRHVGVYLNHNLKFAQFTDGTLRETHFCLVDITTGGCERIGDIAGAH